MAAKSKKQRRRSTPIIELIVRRGALRRFDKLTMEIGDLPAKVSWDRRQGERRSAAIGNQSERRQAERRKKPPFTWEVADFVVVEKRRGRR